VVTRFFAALARRTSDITEALGAALIVAGFTVWLGVAAGLIAGGIALLVRAVAADLGGDT
jgi:hypothetical protein